MIGHHRREHARGDVRLRGASPSMNTVLSDEEIVSPGKPVIRSISGAPGEWYDLFGGSKTTTSPLCRGEYRETPLCRVNTGRQH
jgi:hypothetical protein